ncbi:Putative glycosyltransferase EpsD [Planctomycetes bacterium Pla163]|uniref:Glycosyltransferase EpsD n=1 Tax=Rohdeia mirabilis TaxID=2528008 RepID=A0A518D089_9BACT|nr:Putative glycosyltransferase EpsD [Planctomycetes bacterium Pla163]
MGNDATRNEQGFADGAWRSTRPLRVVHVMESTIGGTRRHLVDVALGQAEAGLDVHVIASCERHAEFRDDLERLAAEGVGVLELPMVRSLRPLVDYSHLRAVQRHLRAIVPDVVHTHSSKGGVLGRVASLRTGIGARVHTPHTFAFLFSHMFGPAKRRVFRSIEERLARGTHVVVAVGAGEAETMLASGVVRADQVRVVPNGIDPGPFETAEPLARADLGAHQDELLLGVVGLLNVAKGQDLALRALARPGAERARLVLVGHGDTEGELRALAADLGVADRVEFLGWRRDVPRILRSLDGLVLPSRWEGLPYVVLEAMAAGTPVLAARVDGARDLVGDGRGGFTFEVESVDGLTGCIAHLASLTRDERERLGASGRATLLAGHTRSTMVSGLEAVYREAVALNANSGALSESADPAFQSPGSTA